MNRQPQVVRFNVEEFSLVVIEVAGGELPDRALRTGISTHGSSSLR
jgi:hypothetical protein